MIGMGGRTEKWITVLMEGLDKNVDEKTLARVLEQCGRQCQSQSFIKKAKRLYAQSKSTNEFLDKLGKVYKHLHREGTRVYLVYPRCYCTRVNKIPKGQLSGTYCNCSRGWAKALFEGALGRDVEVIKEKSIIAGDPECRLRIILRQKSDARAYGD
jgi:hypothetical protein